MIPISFSRGDYLCAWLWPFPSLVYLRKTCLIYMFTVAIAFLLSNAVETISSICTIVGITNMMLIGRSDHTWEYLQQKWILLWCLFYPYAWDVVICWLIFCYEGAKYWLETCGSAIDDDGFQLRLEGWHRSKHRCNPILVGIHWANYRNGPSRPYFVEHVFLHRKEILHETSLLFMFYHIIVSFILCSLLGTGK